MLNNLFKPPVSRSEHERAIRSYETTLAIAIQQRDTAQGERDVAVANYDDAIDRELHAMEQRDNAQVLLQRSLILLKEVDPSRTGGKQLRDAREKLFADAMLAGLWEEAK